MTTNKRKVLPKHIRVAIAFEGGGAKGSFGWAVIEKLHEAGIEPVAVSGTSAGALSAVALAAGKYEEAPRLYRELKLKDIFPFRRHWLLGVPLLAISYVAHAIVRLAKGMNATHVEDEMALANVLPRVMLTLALMSSSFFLLVNYTDPTAHEVSTRNWKIFEFLFQFLWPVCWFIALFGAPSQIVRFFILTMAGSMVTVFLTAFPWKNFIGNATAQSHFAPHSFNLILLILSFVWMISSRRNVTFNCMRAALWWMLLLALHKAFIVLPWSIFKFQLEPNVHALLPYVLGFIPVSAFFWCVKSPSC